MGASKVVNATVIRKVADMSHDIDKRCIKRDVCEKARCLMVENCVHAATKSEVASTLPAPNSAMPQCTCHQVFIDSLGAYMTVEDECPLHGPMVAAAVGGKAQSA